MFSFSKLKIDKIIKKQGKIENNIKIAIIFSFLLSRQFCWYNAKHIKKILNHNIISWIKKMPKKIYSKNKQNKQNKQNKHCIFIKLYFFTN